MISGVWAGYYDCAQGRTEITLTLTGTPDAESKGVTDLAGTFAFSPLPSNPSARAGSFRMVGDLTSGSVALRATSWIVQPQDYVTVNLEGTLNRTSPLTLTGAIDGPGCTDFSVTKQH